MVGVGVRTPVPSRLGPLRSTLFAVVAACLASVVLGGPAHAQETTNSLQSITPADGASLETSPEEIVLVFNQEIGNTEVPIVTLSCNLAVQEIGLAEIDIDGLIATFDIPTPVPRGTCSVSWFLRDADGNNLLQGSTTFAVLDDPPATAAETDATGTGATATTDNLVRVPATPTRASTVADAESQGSTDGALWLGRMLSTMSILIVFGALALISVGWPEGPEYVVTVRFLRLVWLIGLLGTLLYLVAFSADFSGGSFGEGLSPSTWLDLNDAGWAGRGALLRLVVVAASGWVVTRPERIIDPTTAMWAWGVPGVGLIAVAMSSTDGPAAFVGFLVGVVHVFASAIWIGGVALVARVVLAGPGEDDLVQATKAFGKISVPAMLFTALTGVAQMIRLDGGDLFSSSHGRVVLLKALVVAAMLFVALAARQQVAMRLERAHELSANVAERFRRAFTAEAALGVVVLMFSGWLVSLEPAKVDPFAGEDYLPAVEFTDPASGLQARVSIGPGVVGLNGLKVEIDSPAEGLSGVRVRLIPPPSAEGAFIVEQPIRLTGAGTAVRLTADGLPLLASGTWTMELEAVTPQGAISNAVATFRVEEADGSVATTPTPDATQTPNVSVSVIDSTATTAPFATTTTTAPPSTSTPPPTSSTPPAG